MDHVVENYLEEIHLFEDITIINEDVSSFLKKFKPENFKTLISDLRAAVKSKKVDKIQKVMKRIKAPTVPIETLARVGSRMSGDFRDNYKLAKRVLDNSFPTDVDDNIKKAASVYLGMKGMTKKIDYKTTLRKFVELVRYLVKTIEGRIKAVPSSTMFEAVIGWILIIFIAKFVIALLLSPMILGLPWWGGFALLAGIYVLAIVLRSDYNFFNDPKVGETIAGIVTGRGGAYVKPERPTGPTGPEVF